MATSLVSLILRKMAFLCQLYRVFTANHREARRYDAPNQLRLLKRQEA